MELKKNIGTLAKVEKKDDGGRELWGFAILEVVDKAKEIADYQGTVQAFREWSEEAKERSGGKSLGNVRLMHEPVASGILTHWEESEKDLDGNKVKGIWVGVYVPAHKEDVIKDIDSGILTGFSMGGNYKSKWIDVETGATRYIPVVSELSLVDSPCVPGASFENIINKIDNNGKGVVKKMSYAKGSFEEIKERVERALNDKFKKPGENYFDGYPCNTFPDKVVFYDYDSRKYYEAPYTTDADGVITIGESTEVKEVSEWVPVSVQKFIEAELQKRDVATKQAEDTISVLAKAMAAAGFDATDVAKAISSLPTMKKAEIKTGDDANNTVVGGADENDGSKKEYIAMAVLHMTKASMHNQETALHQLKITEHNTHAIGYMNALGSGTEYSCGMEKATIEQEMADQKGRMEKGIPTEWTEQTLAKGTMNNGVSEMKKHVDTYMKNVETAIAELKKYLPSNKDFEQLKKTVDDIANTPMPGAPILNGGGRQLEKMIAGNDVTEAIGKLVHEIQDPIIKAQVGSELAKLQIKSMFGGNV